MAVSHKTKHTPPMFSHKKPLNLAICDNMHGPWGHYAKWSKSDIERQIPHDLVYIQNLKKNPQRHREQIGGCQRQGGRGWGVGKVGEGSQKVQTSSYKIAKSWESRECNVPHGDYS